MVAAASRGSDTHRAPGEGQALTFFQVGSFRTCSPKPFFGGGLLPSSVSTLWMGGRIVPDQRVEARHTKPSLQQSLLAPGTRLVPPCPSLWRCLAKH